MSDGNAFEINTNISGGAQQQNIGQSGGTASLHVDQSSSAVTFDRFLAELSKNIETQSAVQSASGNDLNKTVYEPLKEIAESEEPTNEQDRITLKARIATLLSQLEPYAPYIRKTVAAFAEGALSAIPPPASWIVAGCIEVVRDARRD
jgi:hypothetical protein